MRRVLFMAVCSLCVAFADNTYVDISIGKVDFPKEIKGQSLTIKITGNGGGCVTYDRLVVDRLGDKLEIHLQKIQGKTNELKACTADARPINVIYAENLYPSAQETASGTPPLSCSPVPKQQTCSTGNLSLTPASGRILEIVVNGKSWGKVNIK